MGQFNSIIVEKGAGGFGGPIVITPTETRNKLLYVVGGGQRPEIVDKIVEMTGLEAVNGFHTNLPDEEIAVAVIDCGGNLRCGLYPQKKIPTINILATGQSGPLAKYITNEIYVSAVGVNQINYYSEKGTVNESNPRKKEYIKTQKGADENNMNLVTRIGLGTGKVIATVNQAARNTVQTMITTIIPFIAFIALMISLIQGTGLGSIIAHLLTPLAGNIMGLLIIGFVCSIPFLSPLLGPGAVIAQVVGTLIGVEIGAGRIPPQLALPALFAINNQCGCDFIPVGLGLEEAEPETLEIGVPAILYSRVITGVPRVLAAWIASFGLYQ